MRIKGFYNEDDDDYWEEDYGPEYYDKHTQHVVDEDTDTELVSVFSFYIKIFNRHIGININKQS